MNRSIPHTPDIARRGVQCIAGITEREGAVKGLRVNLDRKDNPTRGDPCEISAGRDSLTAYTLGYREP